MGSDSESSSKKKHPKIYQKKIVHKPASDDGCNS